ncbi:unnamed protein product [Brassica napus]|uniref:(rape) hypothetical protein n=1 Tax=Brassica napus TaxID=3708 RepID=A0A816IS34_BRANA|nr:unnamed protein product [Brassica napus]
MDYFKSKVHPAFFVRDRRAMERDYEEFKGCEDKTEWGKRDWVALGYRRYLYHGWRSVYCMPKRPAFKGSAPINLSDRLHQVLLLRWALASVEIFLSRHLFALFQGLLKVLASWS